MPDLEELIYHITQGFGNHHGSLPADCVQNSIRRDHPLLYNIVVQTYHQGRWLVFLALALIGQGKKNKSEHLNTCSDVLCVFQTEKGSPREQYWRIHLRRDDLSYEAVDRVMEVLRTEAEAALCARMKSHLLQCPKQKCTLREMLRTLCLEWILYPINAFVQEDEAEWGKRTGVYRTRPPVRSVRLTLLVLDHPAGVSCLFTGSRVSRNVPSEGQHAIGDVSLKQTTHPSGRS